MRNLFLLIGLAFCVYFGASLWTFSDPESFKVMANYVPLALMVFTMVLGLVHLRFALALTLGCVLICGNAPLFDGIIFRACSFCGLNTFFSETIVVKEGMKFFQLAPVSYECLVLGLFAAWALTRFFGNPELDFEVNRARTARQMHLPVLLFGLSAILAGLYAVLSSGNVFMPGFMEKVKSVACAMPFPFFTRDKALCLAALRSATLAIELVAFYTVVINEVWSERHIKFFIGFLTGIGLFTVLVGVFQRYYVVGFSSYVFRYTREAHSTFSDPNAWSVYLLTLLPVGLGLLYAGILPAIFGAATILLLLLGIAISSSKIAALIAGITLVIFFIHGFIKIFKGGKIVPPAFVGLLLAGAIAFVVGACINVDEKELLSYKNSHPVQGAYKDVEPESKGLFHNGVATSVADQVDFLKRAFAKKATEDRKDVKDDFASKLSARTNHKSADWHTVINYLSPKNGNWDALTVGCGIGNFKSIYRKYQPTYINEVRGEAGSFLLQSLVEQGVFGFFAMVLISLLTIFVAFGCIEHTQSPRTSRVLAWMFTFLVLGCLFENAFCQYQIATLYWFLCGLVMVNAATTNRDFNTNFKALYAVLIVLCLVTFALTVWPKIMNQRFEKYSYDQAIARLENRIGQTLAQEAKDALYSSGEYNFHRNQVGRWSDKTSYMVVKAVKGSPFMKLEAACGHPKVSDTNPQKVNILVEGVEAMEFTFTNSCLKALEFDLRSAPETKALYKEGEYMIVTIKNNITFNPSEVYAQMADQNYDVGAFIGRVTFGKEPTVIPEAPKEEEDEPQEVQQEPEVVVAPKEEVKEEPPKEVVIPEKTIFGDKVGEQELQEKMEEMSNFELELPN